MTQQEIKSLQLQALLDHRKGLLSTAQLINIVHLLDRRSFVSN